MITVNVTKVRYAWNKLVLLLLFGIPYIYGIAIGLTVASIPEISSDGAVLISIFGLLPLSIYIWLMTNFAFVRRS